MELPVLSLSHFTSGSESERNDFTRELIDSFKATGFVTLINHGFSDEMIQELFFRSKNFFDMPLDVKEQVANPPGPKPQRGWTGVSIESTAKLSTDERIRAMVDIKEHFDEGPADDTTFPNRWPKESDLPGFRAFMEDCYRLSESICLEIVRALEIGLHVPTDGLVERCIPSATDLRLNHYPPVKIEDMRSGNASRISPHTDFGIITILLQDLVGGLEIEDREHPAVFIPIRPKSSSEMIVNVSDTLQRWTNDELQGGVHRVTIPEHMKKGCHTVLPERFTMAYFFKAERQVSVGPLPNFVDNERKPRYDDITALEFQQRRNEMMYT